MLKTYMNSSTFQYWKHYLRNIKIKFNVLNTRNIETISYRKLGS